MPNNSSEKVAALIMEVVPRMMRIIRTEMREIGGSQLTVPQFRILIRIAREPASNQDLAFWMGVSAPTISRMAETLIKRGLLTKKTETGDRRQVILKCTAKGNTLASQIRAAMQVNLTKKITHIEIAQLETIAAGLVCLRESLL